MQSSNPKLNKYLDQNRRYSSAKSEIIREEYKIQRNPHIKKEKVYGTEIKLVNSIFSHITKNKF